MALVMGTTKVSVGDILPGMVRGRKHFRSACARSGGNDRQDVRGLAPMVRILAPHAVGTQTGARSSMG
jgi:hypothetical protein